MCVCVCVRVCVYMCACKCVGVFVCVWLCVSDCFEDPVWGSFKGKPKLNVGENRFRALPWEGPHRFPAQMACFLARELPP